MSSDEVENLLPPFIEKYEDICLPTFMVPFMPSVRNLKVRDDDIFILTYPKCGTTWMQAVVWLIMNEVDTSWNGQQLKDLVPMLEHPFRATGEMTDAVKVNWELKPSPRIFKTHIPLHLLSYDITQGRKRPKIVYVTRNPKDTLVSFYHFETGFKLPPPFADSVPSTFEEFFQRFMTGTCQFGCYWKHTKEVWEHREFDNVLFIHYEAMLKDPARHVKKIAEFLGKSLTEHQISTVVKETSFESMSQNDRLCYELVHRENRLKGGTDFFRKGMVGDWKNHLTVAMSKKIDEFNEENFRDTGLVHDYGD